MIEMIVGMAVSYIAFTEQGHKFGNWVAQIAVNEGKKRIGKKEKTEKEEEKRET